MVSPKILVVIPCFDEEGRIGQVVRSVRRQLPSVDVAVVDDASLDSSRTEAEQAGAVVLAHGCNLGYGATLETGYHFALTGGYDVALQMDGDGQHLADQLPALLTPLVEQSADIVIGSRYGDETHAYEATPLRKLGQRLFAWMIFTVGGLRLSDPTSGFQGLSRRALDLFVSGVFPYDYPDADVILMSRLAGLKIAEVPVKMLPRAGGKSMHSGLRPIYYGAKMLLSTLIVLLNMGAWRAWRRRSAEPGRYPGSSAAA